MYKIKEMVPQVGGVLLISLLNRLFQRIGRFAAEEEDFESVQTTQITIV